MVATQRIASAPWLLLVFSLAEKGASLRVAVWRKLQRFGALPLGNSGYLLPSSVENREKFEWLATTVRSQHGEASVVQVQGIDNRPHAALKEQFVVARQREYRELLGQIKKASTASMSASSAQVARINQRLQEIISRDFFGAPLRKEAEGELDRLRHPRPSSRQAESGKMSPRAYKNRVWVTRPRPGVDRVTSAWLIRKFIDPRARFVFTPEDKRPPNAVPFDMYEGGFGHRGENCTFEALVRVFHIRDKRVARMAQIVHDADLFDDRFGRQEGFGIDAVMKGWAQEGLSDEELLARGMQLAEGLYRSLA
jgi:hypothetical protein